MGDNNYRRRSSDSLVTVNVQCSLSCSTCHGGLSSFEVSRRTLRKNSKYLKRQLDAIERDTTSPIQTATLNDDNDSLLSASSELELHHDGLGFSCRILEYILQTWRVGRYEPVQLPMESFEQLKDLAIALWHYECSPQPFMNFARTVSRAYWHPNTGKDAKHWTFIAVVFGLEKEFGYSVMELAELNSPNSEEPHPAVNRFQIPYEASVPRYIIGTCYPKWNIMVKILNNSYQQSHVYTLKFSGSPTTSFGPFTAD
jgi:hypothetical protein